MAAYWHSTLDGVLAATATPAERRASVQTILTPVFQTNEEPGRSRPLNDHSGLDRLMSRDPGDDVEALQLAKVTLSIATLRMYRLLPHPHAGCLNSIWLLIHSAISCTTTSRPLFNVQCTAEGVLFVPLCIIANGEGVDELWELRVWMPDAKRGGENVAITSCQAFTQNWVLAGEGTDHEWRTYPANTAREGTHAEYSPVLYDGILESVNTGRFVTASKTRKSVHTRGATYSYPAGIFHTLEVAPHAFHATLFLFDAKCGVKHDAVILGHKSRIFLERSRDLGGATLASLSRAVESWRQWEKHLIDGQKFTESRHWTCALQAFSSALRLCEQWAPVMPHGPQPRDRCLLELGKTNRRIGRYVQAQTLLEKVIARASDNATRLEVYGELGTVFRHMDQLPKARHAFEEQYKLSDRVSPLQTGYSCISLGMVDYELSREENNPMLLHRAAQLISKGIEAVRRAAPPPSEDPGPADTELRMQRITWEHIGLGQLSLCYTASGRMKLAVELARQAVDMIDQLDATAAGMRRLFYGRALVRSGYQAEALRQFNTSLPCSPATALCKKRSKEHRRYLRELIQVGANIDVVDEDGYSALDYAVFNEDEGTAGIIIAALPKPVIGRRLMRAQRHKGYRALLQVHLRPELHWNFVDRSLKSIRQAYSTILDKEPLLAELFEKFRFVMYADFLKARRIPSSNDGLTKTYSEHFADSVVLFISYRRLGSPSGTSTPDDAINSQYRRMVMAAEEFLRQRPFITREKLGIWVDYACVDQSNPGTGISALPMSLAQCNAMISLWDESYYDRAWCALEVMMAQKICSTYNTIRWYEHAPTRAEGERGQKGWELRPGPMDRVLDVAETKLGVESDRPTVLFLERQLRLFGT